MKKNMLLVSLFNFISGFTLHKEVLAKCISFLDLLRDEYDFYLLDFALYQDKDIISDYNTSFAKYSISGYLEEINKTIPIKKVYEISIHDQYERIKKEKSFTGITPEKITLDVKMDVIFTFNNYIDPGFNRFAYNKKMKYREIQILSMYMLPAHFDYLAYRYATYLILNETFRQLDATKLQLIADPLDLRFDGFRYLLPDIQESREIDNIRYEYFPFYQYYYFIHTRPRVREKEYLFIVGSTLYDKSRMEMFEKYLSMLFTKEFNNPDYRWYLTGELFGKPYNSFIEASEFSTEVEKTRFGMVLNTYAKDIISTNKLSNFISRNCVPVICAGADDRSRFFPKKILEKLEIKNGGELESLLEKSNYAELNEMLQAEFSNYYSAEYYKKVFAEYF
jgi:hypothetical protein